MLVASGPVVCWAAAGRNAHAALPRPSGNHGAQWSEAAVPSKPASSAAFACSSISDGRNSSVEAANQNCVSVSGMGSGLPATRAAKRAQLGQVLGPPASRERAGAERERLGRVVERERAPAELRSDHRPPAAGLEVERAGAERRAGRVTAVVDQADLRAQLGRDAGGAGAQAQLEVLVEEECGWVEGAERAQQVRARGEAGGDRPADDPRRARPPRL